MRDSRRASLELIGGFIFSLRATLLKILASLCVAAAVAWLPEHDGLSAAGCWALFILTLATGLWCSEAIPAFATGLLVVGLSIAILGKPGGVFAETPDDWERFIRVWGSPLIWLFFGGFVLAAAAEKVGLTIWLARNVLLRFGSRPSNQLLGCMLLTFVFSMFISNTAAATMMIAVQMPIIRMLPDKDAFRTSLLLGVATAANIGGMGTVIGSPPNAVAVAGLPKEQAIDFAGWLLVGLPPAAILLTISYFYLTIRYRCAIERLNLGKLGESDADKQADLKAQLARAAVASVFFLTVSMWLTSSLHGIPSTVIALLPICCLTAFGIIDAQDIRGLPWDVLLLITGGLSLGVVVTDTGLASWLVSLLPLEQLSLFGLSLSLCIVAWLLSNLMSNTAAANILVPIAVAASSGFEAQAVVPIALGASAAMCLPISTPPNAIVYGSGELPTRNMLELGLLLGLIAPPVITAWCMWQLG